MPFLTLYNDDCLSVLKDIPDKSVDLIICDLPYGCLSGRSIGKAAEDKKCYSGAEKGCSWDIKIDLQPFWNEIKRIRKSEHSPCIHFCTTKFGYELIQSNPKEFRYDLVWDKQCGVSFLSANKMPMRSHEMIYVFSKAGAYYNRIDIPSDKGPYKRKDPNHTSKHYSVQRITSGRTDNKRCVLSVIAMPNNAMPDRHPTEKPKDLYKFLIERYCPVGGTVLDPTFGSGNAVFTAYELGRNAIGIEKDKTFFDKAKSRFEALST